MDGKERGEERRQRELVPKKNSCLNVSWFLVGREVEF